MNEKQKARIKEQNARLIGQVKRGEFIEALMPSSATWFQPRPLIKKDPNAIAKIYGEDDEQDS